MIIINYLAIGIFLMFALEAIIKTYSNQIEYIGEEVPTFDNFTRAFCAVIWPVTLAIVLKHMVQFVKNILK
tara:strand:+ start:2888 stop:3100 length:213 start_codon:yes stop_codon:yes gene_type:complete